MKQPIYYFKQLCAWMGAQLDSFFFFFLVSLGISHEAASDGGWNVLDGLLACLAPGWGQLKGWPQLGC